MNNIIKLCYVFLWLLSGVSFCETEDIVTTIQDTPDALFYLNVYSAGREVVARHVMAQTEVEAAVARLEEQRKLLSGAAILFRTKAGSEEEYKATQYKFKVAEAELAMAHSRVNRFAAMLEAVQSDLHYASGDSITLEGLYKSHLASWQAVCAEYESAVNAAQAKINYLHYIATVSDLFVKKNYRGALNGFHNRTELAAAQAEYRGKKIFKRKLYGGNSNDRYLTGYD